jgi:hypothetical protein
MTLWETNYEKCFPVAVIKGEKVGQILCKRKVQTKYSGKL